ncbi:MAG: (d)CMP kinase [Micromonosporaceae bacterium]|nr:(d)CMP kinase [Micromonosporaceae bacterium]
MDGPSGSGKSTVSRRLAERLSARYLDTGAMYRALTWAVLRAGVDPHDADAVLKVLADTRLDVTTEPHAPAIAVNGVPADGPIRGPEVTGAVSAVAAVPGVRAALVAQQQRVIGGRDRERGIVVEGRDIGAVVTPDAEVKVYLTASGEERARRRSAESAADLTHTAADLARRDRLDSTRAASPLQQAPGAVVLDTTALGIDQVVDRLHELLAESSR